MRLRQLAAYSLIALLNSFILSGRNICVQKIDENYRFHAMENSFPRCGKR